MATITEMNKLGLMLSTCLIPFEMRPLWDGWQICYPSADNWDCSVVCHEFSYGHQDGLLEIMGLLTPEEYKMDSVKGWLYADEVFARISKDWRERNAE